MQYELLVPPRIMFGWGRRAEAGRLAAALGRRAFVIHGARALERSGALGALMDGLRAAGVEPIAVARAGGEPTVDEVDAAAAAVRAQAPREGDLVLGLGGGSAIDLAKAVAALAAQPEAAPVREYLEGVGTGRKLARAPLPMLAMPTTGGTGAEATKNAVLSGTSPPFKKSLRDERMIPRVVLVDPELSVSVPPETTAWTGLDAITQCVESYVSRHARPVAQALAVEGLRRALPQLRVAVREPTNRPAREALAHAALLSGMALANSGLGLAHGVAAALGITAGVAHGLACAVMLPTALRLNRDVCQPQLAELARAALGSRADVDGAAADELLAAITALADDLGVPTRLGALGIRAEQLPELVAGSRGNSLSGNPREVTDAELTAVLASLL